jgi:hypothetical protein
MVSSALSTEQSPAKLLPVSQKASDGNNCLARTLPSEGHLSRPQHCFPPAITLLFAPHQLMKSRAAKKRFADCYNLTACF